jgi:hypothetical protein
MICRGRGGGEGRRRWLLWIAEGTDVGGRRGRVGDKDDLDLGEDGTMRSGGTDIARSQPLAAGALVIAPITSIGREPHLAAPKVPETTVVAGAGRTVQEYYTRTSEWRRNGTAILDVHPSWESHPGHGTASASAELVPRR